MTMRFLFLFVLILFISNSFSQVAPNKYFIQFTDKNYNNYNLENPEEFLSSRSLERRARQGILLDMSDLPVSNFYVDSIKKYGVQVLNTTKWFNGATIYSEDPEIIATIQNLGFVNNAVKLQPGQNNKKEVPSKYFVERNLNKGVKSENYYDYGPSWDQVSIHNTQYLHNQGYRGAGIMIAITDAGFTGLPNLPAFDSVYSSNRVIATRNFVHGGTDVYAYSTHGMRVFSIIAGNYPGNLIGTAPEADFALLMSEDPDSEYIIEEYNWISAAEFADSIGADIINVSLGYLNFDDSTQNHTYQDLDGETTPIAIGAKIAAAKGMVVVCAAANSGDSSTHPYINTPGDAKDILTAGAIWSDLSYASFSSIGPSYDGRVKPDVVAMGAGTYNQNLDGSIGTGNGTSFSAPLISGIVACLWQKFPEKTNYQIIDAIVKSSHLFLEPNNYLGYGIPNLLIASTILGDENIKIETPDIQIFPNPFIDTFNIKLNNKQGQKVQIMIHDIMGRRSYLWMETTCNQPNQVISISDLESFKAGVYTVIIKIDELKFINKLYKQ